MVVKVKQKLFFAIFIGLWVLALISSFVNCAGSRSEQTFSDYACPVRLKDETPQQYNTHLTAAELKYCEWILQ